MFKKVSRLPARAPRNAVFGKEKADRPTTAQLGGWQERERELWGGAGKVSALTFPV